MRVMTLLGSPRKNGNTAKVLRWVEEELTLHGHDVEAISLNTLKLKGCLACDKCKKVLNDVGCIQKDDINQILKNMIHADLVVYGSPLYFWGVSAQLKMVIDRTYSLYNDYQAPNHSSLIEGKRQALLMTGADPWHDNAEAAFAAFSRIQDPHKTIHAGQLYVGNCTTPEQLGAGAQATAVDFARTITE